MEKLSLENSWKSHHERTGERPPSKLLVQSVGLVTEKGAALDLGAGGLRDTKFLLQQGFRTVVAVDCEPSVEARVGELRDERLAVVIKSFEEFDFPASSFDLINAQYSLPFIPPESFDGVFRKVKDSLKEGGILVGSLFGKNDEWKGTHGHEMTFHTLDQVRELLSGMEIIDLHEEEVDGATAAGNAKHWHLIYITARK